MRRLLERVAVPGRAATTVHGPRVDVAVETLKRRHLRQVLAIEQQVYPRPWTLGLFHGELDGVKDGHRFYIVAKLHGDIVGYAGLLFALEDAHVTNIAVNPRYQRHGIGRQLLVALAREAISRGSVNLSLEVRVSNRSAQELYRLFGFAPAGIRPRYYENVEDAIVMWCHDINTPDYASKLDELQAM